MEAVDALIRRELPGADFADVFGDWLVSNVAGADEGRYANPFTARNARVERWLEGSGELTGRAPQFGAWYAGVDARQPLQAVFEGRTRTPIHPGAAAGGRLLLVGQRRRRRKRASHPPSST